MKKYNFLIIVIVLYLMGCKDFLNESPKDFISPINFYKTPSQAVLATNSIYAAMKNNNVTCYDARYITTDIETVARWQDAGGLWNYTHSSFNTYVANWWFAQYQGINTCNVVIDNCTDNPNLPDWEKYVAEGKFGRAFFYFNIVRLWGDAPLRLNQITGLTPEELKLPRTPSSKIWEVIISDLEYAINNLSDKGQVEYGRFTKDAARGLLAKVYLTLGSMDQRDAKSDGKVYFKKAMDYSKTIIDGGKYSLEPYYPDAFSPLNEGHNENLIVVQNKSGAETSGWTGMVFGIQGDITQGGSWNMITGTDYLMTFFEPSDTVRRYWNAVRGEIAKDNTPGAYSGILQDWDHPNKYPGLIWDFKPCIAKFRRWPVRDPNASWNNGIIDEPVLRYADVLMIYAEAYNEIYGGPSLGGQPDAFWAVNQVRSRARNVNKGYVAEDLVPRDISYKSSSVPDWRPNFYGYDCQSKDIYTFRAYSDNYTAFKNEILNERARELVGEINNRYYDLVRTGKLLTAVKNVGSYFNPITNRIERDFDWTNNISKRHLLFPIPISEMDANSLMTQNDGF